MKQQIQRIRSKSKWLILLAILIVLAWIFRYQLQNISHWFSDREAIISSIGKLGIWGPIVLFVLLVLQVFLAIIPGHALMVAGSYSFGFWLSFLITTVSTVLGSQIAFLIGRKWGRSAVHKLADTKLIQRWDRLASGQGALFFFFSFVLPIFPSDLMTYVAGLGTISAKRFLLANISGRLLVAGFITFIGAQGLHMSPAFWAAAAFGMAALFFAWKFYSRKHSIRAFNCQKSAGNDKVQFSRKERSKCV